MDFTLTKEQKDIATAAKEFAQKEFPDRAQEFDRQETFDYALWKKACELGFVGVNIKEEYGGAGMGIFECCLVMEEFWAADAGIGGAILSTTFGADLIDMFGTEEQKRKYIPPLPAGEAIMGTAITEPDAGSDAAAASTIAVRTGNEYVINGSKMFITSAEYAGVFVVWAVTDKSAKKGSGISTFLVENGVPGLTIGREEHKMGQCASSTNELIFEDCRIPKSALMGKLNGGFKTAAGELAGGRIGIGSLALGIGLAAMDYATRYAMNRKQFDQPITNFQAIQWMIAESYTELEASRLLLMNAAFKKEQGKPFAREASMAKYYATEAADRACYNAVQMLGGYGYTREFPVERYARDVRITCIYEGTNQIQRLIIARDILNSLKE